MNTISRRFALRSLFAMGASISPISALAPAVSPPPEPAPETTGPLTVAEWRKELERIGWRAVAGDWGGKPRLIIEWGPENNEEFRRSLPAKYRLNSRAERSGADFYTRAARELFDCGLRESLCDDRGRLV